MNFQILLLDIILYVSLFFIFFYFLTYLRSRKEHLPLKKLDNDTNITIIIPGLNEEVGFKNTIESIIKTNFPQDKIKIICIDDGSTDNTQSVLKSYKKYITIISNKKNIGKAKSINNTLKFVKTKYFAILDADSIISENSIRKILEKLDSDKKEIYGLSMIKLKPTNYKNLWERFQLIEYLLAGFYRNLLFKVGLLHMSNGVLSVFRTKFFKEKIKSFDENNLTEDFEVGVRVRKNKYINFEIEESGFTEVPRNLKDLLKQRIRWSRGYIQTHYKHKNLFFNKKYGIFGLYQFPINVLLRILFLASLFLIIYKVLEYIYYFFFKLIYTTNLLEINFLSLEKLILFNDTKINFLIVLSFIFIIYFYYLSIKLYKFNYFKISFFKFSYSIILYFLIMPYIYLYISLYSLYLELRGKKRQWGEMKKKGL